MKIESNLNILKHVDPAPGVLTTPSITPDFWLYRVRLSKKQAIVCFPKFSSYGIGFEREEDWNTNLPFTADAREILAHIKHNKGDDSINDEDCVAAIKALQAVLKVQASTPRSIRSSKDSTDRAPTSRRANSRGTRRPRPR